MAKQPPSVHPKSPVTGKGQINMAPPKIGIGPSKHTPQTGK